MQQSTAAPYLSVVVTTRNDSHGGDPLKRLQSLTNTLDAQCRRTGLATELIVVEWNPPPDRPRVSSLLRLPDAAFCTYRFIEVPPELHQSLQCADVLPLFQMIAKNVGIRRARGQFVLATNIDIIFSNELVDFIAAGRLERGCLYRVDRHDIQADFPVDAPLAAQMEYCRSHQLRVHTRWGSFAVDGGGRPVAVADDIVDGRTVRLGRGWHVREGGCGSRPYRWASECIELIVDGAREPEGSSEVLDIAIESNPYDQRSWVEIVATEHDHPLARTRVAGQVRFTVPLAPSGGCGERRIELRVTDSADSSRHLPAFERRDSLLYRVGLAQLRAATEEDATSEYPLADWKNAFEWSAVELRPTSDGLAVSTDPRKFSYAIEYGPLLAHRTGLHRFDMTFTVVEGDIAVAVLNGDRAAWLPATVNRQGRERAQRFEIAVDLQEKQPFWIMISNDHPQGEGASKIVLHQMHGSADPSLATVGPAQDSAEARSLRAHTSQTAFGVLRRQALKLVDALAPKLAAAMGDGLRYRLVRGTKEFQAVERALRTSDEHLREIAPLRYLAQFSTFLVERRPQNLHLNGCGDFHLMAREHWDDLRAYAEFETFSMNIDGLLSHVAHATGIEEKILDMPIYHLEHEVGSGWSPEGEAQLRRRIAERGITWLDASTVYIWAAYMHWLHRPMIFNDHNWGMAGEALPERVVRPCL
jgi:hypothetical protein